MPDGSFSIPPSLGHEWLDRVKAEGLFSARTIAQWRRDTDVEQHLLLHDARRPDQAGDSRNPQAVHGTPITPKELLQQMAGASFCVSFWAPEQLKDVVGLLADDSILLLDNGAWSAFTKGVTLDRAYWDRYWEWAVPVLRAYPQALAVIPDVIGGTVAENNALLLDLPDIVWGYDTQLMPVWHMDEPLEYLEYLLDSYGRIAFGATGEYRAVGTNLWRARTQAAFDAIEAVCGDMASGIARPRIHMLRGLGQLAVGEFPFSSADSTNLARNHHRLIGGPSEETRVAAMRARIEAGAFPAPPGARWPLPSYAPAPPGPQPSRRPLQRDLFVS